MEYQDRKIRLDVFSFASMTEDKITEWMNSVFGEESTNGGELPELPYGYLFTSTESNETGKYLKFGVHATFHKIRNHNIVPYYRITRGEEVTYEEYLATNGVDYSLHEYTESPHVTGTYVESEEAPEQNGYYLDYEYGYKTKMNPEMMEEDITSFLRIVDDTDGNKTIFQVI